MFTSESSFFHPSSHSSTREFATRTQSVVRRIVVSLLPDEPRRPELDPSTRLCDLGIGSFTLIGLVVQLEDELALDETALGQIHGGLCVDELCSVCERSLARARRAMMPEVAQ